jgi:hypothetical protein
MDATHAVNLLTAYRQQENNFTNGLFSLLRIAAIERPEFVTSFLRRLEKIRSTRGFEDFGKPYGKDKTPYRNITREQYRRMIEAM